MLQALDALVAAQGGAATRQDVIQTMANHFIMEPKFYEPVDVLELREPVTELITITVSKSTEEALKRMAKEHGMKMSALMRNIFYCGLR